MKRLFTWMAFLLVNASVFANGSVLLWNGSGNEQWNTPANWTPQSGSDTFPQSGDTAEFRHLTSGTTAVKIDAGSVDFVTVVHFFSDADQYTFQPSSNVLTFTTTTLSPNALIQVDANSQTFNNDTHLSADTTLTIASGASLTNNGEITSTSSNASSLFVNGAAGGTFTNGVVIDFLNTFQINDVVFVNNDFISDNTLFQINSGQVTNNAFLFGTDPFALGALPANTFQMTDGTLTNNIDFGFFATGTFSGETIKNNSFFGDFFSFTQTDNSTFNNNSGAFASGFAAYDFINGTINNHSDFVGRDGGIIPTATFVQTGGVFNNFSDGTITAWDRFIINDGVTINDGVMNTITQLTVSGSGLFQNNSFTNPVLATTFTVSGNGTYEPLVRDAANTAVVDATTLNLGGNLLVNIAPNFDDFNGTPVDILNGAVNGRFATVSTTNAALRARAIYNADSVDVVFGPAVPVGFVLPELRETIWASVNHANFRVERELVKVRQRMCSCGCPWNVYGGFIGSQGEFNRNFDRREFDYQSVGGLVGIDYTCKNWALGVQFNYDNIYNDDNDHRVGKFNVDFARGSFFATYVPQCMSSFAFDFIVGGGGQWWDLHRNVFTGGLVAPFTAHSHTDVTEWDILGGVEYAWDCSCNSLVVPYATVQYVRLDFDRFRERDAGFFGFDIHNNDIDSLRSVLGFRWLGNYNFCNIWFQPELDLGWEHEFYDDVNFFFEPIAVGGFGVDFNGRRIGREFLLFAADFFFGFCGNWGIDVSYDLEWNQDFQNHTYYVGADYRF